MKKNLMLFTWFIKFGFLTSRDEYDLHDHIKEHFCPDYISNEEFDKKEQLLRDTAGPAGIKYAYYVGSKVNGVSGAATALTAMLIPIIAVAVTLYFAYDILFGSGLSAFSAPAVRAVHAATLGLIAAHLYKIVYFNKTNRKSLFIIIPAAMIFLFLPGTAGIESAAVMPFYVISVIVVGILFGFIHSSAVKYREKHPNTKYIDPHSKKAQKLRDRQLREDEEALKKDVGDNYLKLRKKELEDQEKNRKHKGEE